MGYSKTFRRRISVPYSGYVSVPAEQRGGSVSYSGEETVEVEVVIDIDSSALEASVADCNDHVDALTGAVTETEAAQILSIADNAHRIGKTITTGFFSAVRSEISQQIAEWQSKLSAALIALNATKERCIGTQHRLEGNYNQVAAHYMKIFEELNTSLQLRIMEVNKPIVLFKEQLEASSYVLLSELPVSVAAIGGGEQAIVVNQLQISHIKQELCSLFEQISHFLECSVSTQMRLRTSCFAEQLSATHYVVVLYTESEGQGYKGSKLHVPPPLQEHYEAVHEAFAATMQSERTWGRGGRKVSSEVEAQFYRAVDEHFIQPSLHDERVKKVMYQLFEQTRIKTL